MKIKTLHWYMLAWLAVQWLPETKKQLICLYRELLHDMLALLHCDVLLRVLHSVLLAAMYVVYVSFLLCMMCATFALRGVCSS